MSNLMLFPTQTEEDTYITPEVYNYEDEPNLLKVKSEPLSSSSEDSSSVSSEDSNEILNQNQKPTNFSEAFNTMDTRQIEPITINSEDSSSVKLPMENVVNSSEKIVNFNKAFEAKSLKNSLSHITNCNDIFKCQFCDYSTMVRNFLLQHLKSCDKKVQKQCAIKSYQCHICSYNTSVSGCLSIHLQKLHNVSDPDFSEGFNTMDTRQIEPITINSEDSSSVELPMENVVNSSVEIVNFTKAFEAKSLKNSLSHITNCNDIFKCQFCDYSTMVRDFLLQHLKSCDKKVQKQRAIKSYQCHLCSYNTSVWGCLSIHLHKLHNVSDSDFSEDSIEILNQNQKSTNFSEAFNTMDTRQIEPITINSEDSSSVELPMENVINSSVEIVNFTKAFEAKSLKNSLSLNSNCNDIFKCQFCNYSTMVRNFLLQHLKSCDKKVRKQRAIKSYQCHLCSYDTSVSGWLLIHLHKFHNVSDPDFSLYECKVCSYSSAVKKYFIAHIRSKKHKLFSKRDPAPVRSSCTCPFCDYNTESYYHLRKHILGLHAPLKLFECDQCDYIGAKKSYFTLHNQIHGTTKSGANCGICNFSTKGNLKYHYSMCHSSVMLGTPEELVKSQELTEDNNPVCYVCQYRAESYYHIRKHLKLHTPIKPTECDKCDYVTGPIEELFDHYHLMHQNNELLEFKCSNCNFPTNSSDSLEHHNEMYHKSLRAAVLEQNIRSLRPLVSGNLTINNACWKCGIAFKDRFDFKRHCTEGHVVADQNLVMKREKYRCQFCVFHSKYEKEFKCHIYRHKDDRLKCDNCHINFGQVTDLDQHILVFHQHCNLCEVGFRTSWDQLKHQTIHNRKCRVWLKRLPPKLTVPRVRVCLAVK